jgi:hypothetical protein
MADTAWQVIPTIVSGRLVPDQWSKGVYNNMDLLSNPTRQIEQGQIYTNYDFDTTVSTTYVAVNANYWTRTFYSSGRDILINIRTAAQAMTSSGAGQLTFEIDGVSPFPDSGFMTFYYNNAGTYAYHPFGFQYPIFDLAPGSHVFRLMMKSINGANAVGVATVTGYNTFTITEF